MLSNTKSYLIFGYVLSLFSACSTAAANFDISPTPGTTLPTTVSLGGIVSASYTITNQTHSTRKGYTIKGLPSTVTQNTTTGTCAALINLSKNESCVLILDISGEAVSNFALCSGSTCTSASAPLNIHATTASDLVSIAVGRYADTDDVIRPLLALNMGSSSNVWSYPAAITVPDTKPAFSQGELFAASCSGSLCIAAGRYTEDSGDSTRNPLLALTTDSGNTWSFPEDITQPTTDPIYTKEGTLLNANCNGRVCLAGGYYQDGQGFQHPLLAVSRNDGSTWIFPTSITKPETDPTFVGPSSIQGTICTGRTCMAAGHYFYELNTLERPMIALSTDEGSTWTFPKTITQPDTDPEFGPRGALLGIARCGADTYVASGTYRSASSGDLPLLALSKDAGQTWTFPTSITNPVTHPSFHDIGILRAPTCSGNTCIAAGRYNDGSTTLPLLALSTDACNTWSYPEAITNPTITPALSSGVLTGESSCSDMLCIAVGNYVDATAEPTRRPLLALSQDAGKTWSYPEAITNPKLIPEFTHGILRGASCSNNSCIASGEYTATDGITRPLMAVTNDGGTTWTFPTTITDTSTIIPSVSRFVRLNSASLQN